MFCLQNSNLWRNIHVNVDQRISRLLCRVVVRTSHNTSAWGYGQYSWWNVKYNVCSYNTVSFPLKLNSKHGCIHCFVRRAMNLKIRIAHFWKLKTFIAHFMKAGAEALMLGRGHSQKEKREANGPQRSPEYKRIYIDFWSEGHIFSYQSIKINSGRRNLHYIPLMK